MCSNTGNIESRAGDTDSQGKYEHIIIEAETLGRGEELLENKTEQNDKDGDASKGN
jgi:hypothetical protein